MLQFHPLRRSYIALLLLCVILLTQTGCSSQQKDLKIPVQVLILPKFEVGELTGDFPGEAQLFYEEYLAGGDVFEIDGAPDANKVYYKNGVALFLLGQGKVNAALSTSALLLDERFDFSNACILSVGCGGAAKEYGIFGDVFVISTAVDFDLGHRADARELRDPKGTTWFHDESLDDSAIVRLDQGLTDRVYDLVKDVHLETTEKTADALKKEYPGEA